MEEEKKRREELPSVELLELFGRAFLEKVSREAALYVKHLHLPEDCAGSYQLAVAIWRDGRKLRRELCAVPAEKFSSEAPMDATCMLKVYKRNSREVVEVDTQLQPSSAEWRAKSRPYMRKSSCWAMADGKADPVLKMASDDLLRGCEAFQRGSCECARAALLDCGLFDREKALAGLWKAAESSGVGTWLTDAADFMRDPAKTVLETAAAGKLGEEEKRS